MVANAPFHAFLEFYQPVVSTIFIPSHWLLSHSTIVETTDSSERVMNPVAMTIINPLKKYLPSRGLNQQPLVLKSAKLPTELWGLAPWQQNLEQTTLRTSVQSRTMTNIGEIPEYLTHYQRKILNQTNMGAFAEDKINLVQMIIGEVIQPLQQW